MHMLKTQLSIPSSQSHGYWREPEALQIEHQVHRMSKPLSSTEVESSLLLENMNMVLKKL